MHVSEQQFAGCPLGLRLLKTLGQLLGGIQITREERSITGRHQSIDVALPLANGRCRRRVLGDLLLPLQHLPSISDLLG